MILKDMVDYLFKDLFDDRHIAYYISISIAFLMMLSGIHLNTASHTLVITICASAITYYQKFKQNTIKELEQANALNAELILLQAQSNEKIKILENAIQNNVTTISQQQEEIKHLQDTEIVRHVDAQKNRMGASKRLSIFQGMTKGPEQLSDSDAPLTNSNNTLKL